MRSERGELTIERSELRRDLLSFGVPALVVFAVGLVVCAASGYDGLLRSLWLTLVDAEHRSSLTAANIAGLVLAVGGVALAIGSVVVLGTNYSSSLVIRRGHRLIAHGPYRVVRHPIYLGVLVAALAVPVYASTLAGLAVMALLFPLFAARIRREDRLLEERFGDEYRAWRGRTPALLPLAGRRGRSPER